jgi:filamentous hemagglutinin family protein
MRYSSFRSYEVHHSPLSKSGEGGSKLYRVAQIANINFYECAMNNTKNCSLTGFLITLETITQLSLLGIFTNAPVLAQITPDTTLGTENSHLTKGVNIKGTSGDLIEGGGTRGSNLFHSFSEFNVNNGQRVYFDNPTGINNIFSRVTGSNVSNILGTLGVNGNANLYILNPNGIIFGKNAQLDIQGAFFATTANSFKFKDGNEFSATNPQMPLLTMSVPVGVQFGSQPGDISSQGNLRTGKDLTLNAGNLKLEGQLKAGGNLTLYAVDTVSLNQGIVQTQISGATGNVGSINIATRNLFMTNGAVINASTLGQGNAGNITIKATDTVSLNGVDVGILNEVKTGAMGNGGNVQITTRNFSVTNGAYIQFTTDGQGNAGNITIEATDTVSFDKGYLFNVVTSKGVGNGGNVQITTRNFSVTNGGYILFATEGQGNVGNITIEATDTVFLNQQFSGLFNQVDTQKLGNGGDIKITTRNFFATNGALISVSTFGNGNAGNITIDASDVVFFKGIGTNKESSSVFSQVNREAVGNGGEIKITTRTLSLFDDAFIAASTFGQGNAGNITLETSDSISFDHSYLLNAVEKSALGNGGNVKIKTLNLSLTDGAVIDARALGQGNAGNIEINSQVINLGNKAKIEVNSKNTTPNSSAGTITLETNFLKLDNASITATNTSGKGGNIDINTQNLLLRNNSEISTTAGSENTPGNGGQITINAKDGYVVAVPTENSDIVANAFGGNGGKINISAIRVLGLKTRERLNTAQLQAIRTNRTSDISASSDVGTDGIVAIQTLGIDPSQGLVTIPVNLVDRSGLIAQGCNSNNSNAAQSQSEFVVTGRGGLPPSPDDVLTVGALTPKWVTKEKGDRVILLMEITPTTEPLIEAQAMVRNANGDIVLISKPVISTGFQSGLSSRLCGITQKI